MSTFTYTNDNGRVAFIDADTHPRRIGSYVVSRPGSAQGLRVRPRYDGIEEAAVVAYAERLAACITRDRIGFPTPSGATEFTRAISEANNDGISVDLVAMP